MLHIPYKGGGPAVVAHVSGEAAVGFATTPSCITHIKSGRLISVLDEHVREDVPIYAVYPSNRHLSPKVRAFVDYLVEMYGPRPYWLDYMADNRSASAAAD